LIYFLLNASEVIGFGVFMLLTTLGLVASTLLGAVFGIASKNQAAASTMVTPLMLVLMVPMFFPDNFLVDNILYYFFTEQILISIANIAFDDGGLEMMPLLIVAANIFVMSVIFGVYYKKRGLGVE